MPRQRDAAALVEPLLRFNQVPAEPWTEGDVDVLVVENQGVWLWGRTDVGEFVERANEPDAEWQPIAEDEEGFWLHHAPRGISRRSGQWPRAVARFNWIRRRCHGLKMLALPCRARSGHGRARVIGCGTDPARWP